MQVAKFSFFISAKNILKFDSF